MAAGGGVEPQGLMGPAESDDVLDALNPSMHHCRRFYRGLGLRALCMHPWARSATLAPTSL